MTITYRTTCDRCDAPTSPSAPVCAACVTSLAALGLRWCTGCHTAKKPWRWQSKCTQCKTTAQSMRNWARRMGR